MISYIRSQDPDTRAQQWARYHEATTEFCDTLTAVRTERSLIFHAKEMQIILWHSDNPDIARLKNIAIAIKDSQERLQLVTDRLSSLQSELEALQTALQDDED